MEMNTRKELLVECNCGCGILKFEHFSEDNEILISFYESAFYAHQKPIVSAVRQYFKRLWSSITGRDYAVYDLVLTKDQSDKFRDDMDQWLRQLS